MSRKNKSYLAELKYQAVGDYLSGEGPLREICKKYGIRDKHTLNLISALFVTSLSWMIVDIMVHRTGSSRLRLQVRNELITV